MKVRALNDYEIDRLNSVKSITEFPKSFSLATLHKNCAYAISDFGGNALKTKGVIIKGEVVVYADGEKINRPIVYSLQISENVHTIGPGGLDHVCNSPNCGVDPKTHNIVALRDIDAGQFLFFNYLTTEWELASPFECKCGDNGCFENIKGFKYLSTVQRQQILGALPVANHITNRLKE